MSAQDIFNTDFQADPSFWWDNIYLHADRFFSLAHTYNASADRRLIESLANNLTFERQMVAEAPYTPAMKTVRATLLDAMDQTILAINAHPTHSGHYFQTAQRQLQAFQIALDNHM